MVLYYGLIHFEEINLIETHCNTYETIVATYGVKNAPIQKILHGHNQVNFIQQKFCDTFNEEGMMICVTMKRKIQ